MLRLFRVTCWDCAEAEDDTFENFVIASNEIEAKRIVEEEIWTLSGMGIKCVEEIDMSLPQILCSCVTVDIE